MKVPENKSRLAALVDSWHEDHSEERRPHLGASLLGHPCDRWIWLSFRWAVANRFPGRVLRLFRRGHREEETVIADLRSVGLVIHSALDEQVQIDYGCHVKGTPDGIIESGVPEAPKARHVLEIKTHKSTSFKKLLASGVAEAFPQHYCQMQISMHGAKIERALYYPVCKDDDEIAPERVKYDKEAAMQLVDRGHRLATTERIPPPLSADPTWYQCKFCSAYDFCHQTDCTDQINCRTCAHATPEPNSTWTCARYAKAVIPIEVQRVGCECHVLHPDLVPWEWEGGTADGLNAIYKIDGVQMVNGEGDANVYSSEELLKVPPKEEEEEEGVDLPF